MYLRHPTFNFYEGTRVIVAFSHLKRSILHDRKSLRDNNISPSQARILKRRKPHREARNFSHNFWFNHPSQWSEGADGMPSKLAWQLLPIGASNKAWGWQTRIHDSRLTWVLPILEYWRKMDFHPLSFIPPFSCASFIPDPILMRKPVKGHSLRNLVPSVCAHGAAVVSRNRIKKDSTPVIEPCLPGNSKAKPLQ